MLVAAPHLKDRAGYHHTITYGLGVGWARKVFKRILGETSRWHQRAQGRRHRKCQSKRHPQDIQTRREGDSKWDPDTKQCLIGFGAELEESPGKF